MKILALYGFGGLGHEILELANQINIKSFQWDKIVAVNDFIPETVIDGTEVYPFNVLREKYTPEEMEVCICLGEPLYRERMYEKVKACGYRLTALIHPDVHVPESSVVGEGCIISDGVYLSVNTRVSENALINVHAIIGHDTCIGKHSVISPGVSIGGHCQIGKKVFIAMMVPVKEEIQMEDSSVAGMGAVVVKNVPEGMIVMGNPARVIAKNEGIIFK